MVWILFLLIIVGIIIDVRVKEMFPAPPQAETVIVPAKKEVPIEVTYSRERIVELIKETFPEAPNTATAVFMCESGLNPKAKGPTSDYGIAQVHSPSWDREAKRLGYKEYRTDVKENLAMARHIYEDAGKSFSPWVCYTKGMHKKYL